VIGLGLPAGELTVLCIGAHPDDIEIGCGGTLLALGAARPISAHCVVLTSTAERRAEAEEAAASFLPGSTIDVFDLPDGRLPAHWSTVKNQLESVATSVTPHVIFAPRRDDAHQDHRLVAELATTVWRDSLVLHYEIPKWDGDFGQVTHYVPVPADLARRKVEQLDKSYPSQVVRDWWDEETFLGLMRLRGVECRNRYAEGFVVDKTTISF
jgi:LmbE family N-acetylglucosaminyl deacetylase